VRAGRQTASHCRLVVTQHMSALNTLIRLPIKLCTHTLSTQTHQSTRAADTQYLLHKPHHTCSAGGAKPRWQKQVPEVARYLGWCTWDAFYHDVSALGIIQGLQSFKAAGTPPAWIIVDDGWQVRGWCLIGGKLAKVERCIAWRTALAMVWSDRVPDRRDAVGVVLVVVAVIGPCWQGGLHCIADRHSTSWQAATHRLCQRSAATTSAKLPA
jgi:hypothetical protein